MLRKILWIAGALIVVVAGYVAYLLMTTRNLSPRDIAQYQDENFSIEVHYGRPFKRGRLIFGDEKEKALVPYANKWRTGANEATEITFTKDIVIYDKQLKAGRYSLYTVPGPEQWMVVFNSKVDYWGAKPMGDPFDETMDVLRVPALVVPTEPEVEQFTISFAPTDSLLYMNFFWDKTRVALPIKPAD